MKELEETLKSSIKDLSKYKFIIPEYQRGYRWENDEIDDLLKDIEEALYNRDVYYLQPITIKKANREGEYYLIDGQQRLTTILIILILLHSNENEIYTMYEKNLDNEDEINDTRNNDIKRLITSEPKQLNEYYFKNAIERIEEYLKKHKDDEFNGKFKKYIYENVKVIRYELKETENENERFLKMNTNHIQLEQADLIKAELLVKHNVFNDKIAVEYDTIERKLNDDKFWYFITNDVKTDRMTKLFEISIKNLSEIKNPNKKNYLHEYYKELIKKDNRFIDVWKNVKNTFEILNNFYEDIELYNLIGCLIIFQKNNENINEIIEKYNEKKTKEEFKRYLYNEIIKVIDGKFNKLITSSKDINMLKSNLKNTNKLNYENSKQKGIIENILILHNVLTLNFNDNNKNNNDYKLIYKYNQRFPFEVYKNVKWNLEHINSRKDKDLEKLEKEERPYYINYLKIKTINNRKSINDIDEILMKIDDLNKYTNSNSEKDSQNFKEDVENILRAIGDNDDGIIKESICNLVLLDENTNKKYHNSLFMRKREEIIKQNKFIPICTIKAFLRGYTDVEKEDHNDIMQFFEWNVEDAENYLSDIAEKIFAIKEEAQNG